MSNFLCFLLYFGKCAVSGVRVLEVYFFWLFSPGNWPVESKSSQLSLTFASLYVSLLFLVELLLSDFSFVGEVLSSERLFFSERSPRLYAVRVVLSASKRLSSPESPGFGWLSVHTEESIPHESLWILLLVDWTGTYFFLVLYEVHFFSFLSKEPADWSHLRNFALISVLDFLGLPLFLFACTSSVWFAVCGWSRDFPSFDSSWSNVFLLRRRLLFGLPCSSLLRVSVQHPLQLLLLWYVQHQQCHV